jgi:hypothetical protein
VTPRTAEPARLIADIGEGTLEYRIDQLIASRLRVAEQTQAFGTLARRKLMLTPEIPPALTNVLALQRSQLEEQFAPEFQAMSNDEAAIVTDILLTLISFEGLDVMWRRLGKNTTPSPADGTP